MLRRLLSAVPGLKPAGAGHFYYPRRGFGQISDAYHTAARAAGAELHLGATVQAVAVRNGGGGTVSYTMDGAGYSLETDHVWSTVPVTELVRLLRPAPPAEILTTASALEFRAMILIYLVLEQDRFSEYDAHYFPEPGIALSRLSEPKNYWGGDEPRDTTVLCGELPCSPADAVWGMTDEELGRLAGEALAAAGIPIRAPVRQVTTRRLRQAYPIYRAGHKVCLKELLDWLDGVPGLLTLGRQGLFVHDNAHHALYMGYAAASCLDAHGRFDRARWRAFRAEFETHVVED
jgi:protoporphyrinogen oxidase